VNPTEKSSTILTYVGEWFSNEKFWGYQFGRPVKIVDQSTVRRIEIFFDQTGSVDFKSYPQSHRDGHKKLSQADEYFILQLVVEMPGIYLREIQYELWVTNGTAVSEETIMRFLKASGFTRKKLQHTAIQRSEDARARYLLEMGMYKPEMLVFVDESGTDRRDAMRRFGYSLRGRPCIVKSLLARGKRVSVIAALAVDSVLDFYFTHGTTNGETFKDFIERSLLPHLMPFDGTNPRSVVILDNAPIHHCDGTVGLIESTGALVIFLPPYSPDLNLIEETFASIKSYLRTHEDAIQSDSDLQVVMMHAFASITTESCQAWFKDCGY